MIDALSVILHKVLLKHFYFQNFEHYTIQCLKLLFLYRYTCAARDWGYGCGSSTEILCAIHTKEFLAEIKSHYECHDADPEMKLEKLWMLETCAMDPSTKVFSLECWNQPPAQRVQLKFSK